MRSLIVATAVLASLAQIAHARTDPRSLTCQQAQDLVRKSGSIVMNTGPNTWAEIVASSAQCRVSSARRQSVQTRDNPGCNVGFVCRPRTGGR
jgi:hypothetical protein